VALSLQKLFAPIAGARISGNSQVTVTGVTADSREAGPGVLFLAVRGTTVDGHDYLAQAAAAGCSAVAVETGADLPARTLAALANLPVIRVTRTRDLPARLSRHLRGCPDQTLCAMGITGTNGKTTTAFLLQGLLNQLAGPCGLMGTIRYEDGLDSLPAPLTTPGGPVLFHWLGRMRDNGCRSVALEVSSHALDQDRAAGLELDVAVMTNLGRDHLDYHADLDDYLRAKAGIMSLLERGPGSPKGAGSLVLNAADPSLAGLDTGDHPVIRFAAGPVPAGRPAADLTLQAAELTLDGTVLDLVWHGATHRLHSPLVGRFNVENLMAALAAGLAGGFDLETCLQALSGLSQVPGRLERFALPSGGIAVVDYAHTHDALAAVLETCDELGQGRLLVVFGAGGDRDRGKRPLMGEVAARLADGVWITSDNPRSEDPAQICADIQAGLEACRTPRAREVHLVVDRTTAIEAALAAAAVGDIVVVAGKGHEDYQLVGDQVLDLDDRRTITDWTERHPS